MKPEFSAIIPETPENRAPLDFRAVLTPRNSRFLTDNYCRRKCREALRHKVFRKAYRLLRKAYRLLRKAYRLLRSILWNPRHEPIPGGGFI